MWEHLSYLPMVIPGLSIESRPAAALSKVGGSRSTIALQAASYSSYGEILDLDFYSSIGFNWALRYFSESEQGNTITKFPDNSQCLMCV